MVDELGLVEFILISVTLGAAILGTISNPGRNIKIALISLAILASIATLIKTSSTAKENSINKKLIIALVQASNPPLYFSHDLVKELSPLVKSSYKKYVSGQTIEEDSGERIFMFSDVNGDSDDVTGLLYVSKKAMGPVYYAYATGESVGDQLNEILSSKWADCHSHWNQCLNELSAISKMALELAPIAISETTSSMDGSPPTFEIVSDEAFQGEPIKIVLGQEFIESLYGLNSLDRGLKILQESQKYIIDHMRPE